MIVARTDANAATLLTSDIDPRDHAVPHRRAHGRGLLPRARAGSTRRSPAGWPMRPMPTCSGARPPSRTWPRRGSFAEAIHARVPRQAAGLQLLAVVQLEEEARRRDDRQLPARAGRDGLQVPVRHAGRLPRAQLQHVRAGARLPRARHGGLLPSCSRPSSPAKRMATRRPSTSAKWAPATSTRWPQVIAGGETSTRALHGSTEHAQFH